jgi:DNA-binding ferritin-like protein (Dps family)
MAAKWIELVTGSLEEKKRWREYKARKEQLKADLPAGYRTAIDALERYFMYVGGADEHQMMPMLEDLIELFERAAADGTPVPEVVGEDPVEFAETFVRNYGIGSWINRERQRLTDGIDRAAREQQG